MITTIPYILLMATAMATEEDDSPSTNTTVIDVGIITLGALGYLGANQIPITTDTLRSNPTGIDAWIEPQWHPEWAWSSDFLGVPYAHYGFNLPLLTVAAATVWGGTTQSNWGTAIPVVQAVAITATLTETTKRLVSRPRPYTSIAFEEAYPDTYNSESMQTLRANPDTFKSFPSGHTSNAAATYFTTAAIIAQQTNNANSRILAYGTATALTGLTGYSRVRYGKHHISDTLVGAAIGSSIGLGVAYLHERWR